LAEANFLTRSTGSLENEAIVKPQMTKPFFWAYLAKKTALVQHIFISIYKYLILWKKLLNALFAIKVI
jgi:hypothetical protein